MRDRGVAERNRFLAAVDHLFGYDVFISYGRADATAYARQLAEELEGRDISCFLDRRELPPGYSLDETLRAALRRSSVLVVISTAHSRASAHVAREVQTFAPTKRPIVPIALDGEPMPWTAIRERNLVWIEDAPEALSPNTVAAVTGALRVMRKRTLASRVMLSAAGVLLAVSLLAMLAAVWARREQVRAEEQTAIARREESRAVTAAALADQRRITANIDSLARQALSGNQSPDQTLLIAAESVRRAQQAKLPVLATAEHALRQAVARMGGMPLGRNERVEVRDFAYAADHLYVLEDRTPSIIRGWRIDERGARALSPLPLPDLGYSAMNIESSAGGRLVIASADTIAVWRDGRRIATLDTHADGRDDFAVSPDGRWLAAGDSVYDLTAKNIAASRVQIGEFGIHAPNFVFSPDGKWLVLWDGWIWLWEMTPAGPRVPARMRFTRAAESIWAEAGALSTDAVETSPYATETSATDTSATDTSATSAADGPADPAPAMPVSLPSEPPPDPALRPRVLQTGEIDFSETYGREQALAFSPDGRWMALAGRETVAVWDLQRRDVPRVDIAAKGVDFGRGADVAFSPSSEWLFISGDRARAFRAPSFRQSIALGRAAATAIAVSPDQKWLATAGRNIALWDLRAARPFAKPVHVLEPAVADTNTFEMLGKYVRTLAFSGDGRWLVSTAATGRIWDLQQPDPNVAPVVLRLDYSDLAILPNPDDWFLRYAFTSDSRYLLALSTQGTDNLLAHYRLIPLRAPELLRFVDASVKRGFTPAEWAWLFPGEPFRR